MKGIVAFIFGLLLIGCSATLPPPTNLAVLIALSSPTPALISDYEPTWQPQTIIGKVVGVSDGDTITVLDADKRQHKIRLEGIDAPESNQDFGSRAKQSLSDLVFGKTVTVTSWKKNKYGRTLGTVTLDGNDINLEQVQRGMAWSYHYSANEVRPEEPTAYELAEEQARKEKRGLWADASPVPPWEFRQSGKTAKAPGATPPATATGPIVGNRNSKIYHMSNCPDYNKVSERNRVPFKTEAEAQAAGYRKAKNCPQ
jgi:endonuclease YncB( thermonuclease family)